MSEVKGISPDQLAELTKLVVLNLTVRNHAEACFMHEHNPAWHIKYFLDELGGFACDQVESDVGYPETYQGLLPIEEQVHLVAEQFQLKSEKALVVIPNLPDVSKWAEGWAALPILEQLPGDHWSNLQKALIWLNTICGNRPRCYAGSGGTGGLVFSKHVRPHFMGEEQEKWSYPRNDFARNWKKFGGGDIMIVPVQLGALRRGQSDRMVKAHCLKSERSEFPLGAFEVACLLAMHPSRIRKHREQALAVNTPGDEYNAAGYIQTLNCRWYQMAQFIRLDDRGLPNFCFAWDNLRDRMNAPFTASSWNLKEHLG